MMNHNTSRSQPDAAEKLARHIASRLNDDAAHLPHDISERLRVARLLAVNRHKEILVTAPSSWHEHNYGGALISKLGAWGHGWGNRLGAVGLLLALASGLLVIDTLQDEQKIRELAAVDSALLTDELPPAAYLDVGFAQFLKTEYRQQQ
jgi:hypothetical protein